MDLVVAIYASAGVLRPDGAIAGPSAFVVWPPERFFFAAALEGNAAVLTAAEENRGPCGVTEVASGEALPAEHCRAAWDRWRRASSLCAL